MTAAFTLGQRVRIADYLVRVDASAEAVVALDDIWPDTPPAVVTRARSEIENARPRRHWRSRGFRIYAPASIVCAYPRHEGLYDISFCTRRHPFVYPSSISLPADGIVVQQVQCADGSVIYDEDGTGFYSLSVRLGYHVAYHLARRPMIVLPSMVAP